MIEETKLIGIIGAGASGLIFAARLAQHFKVTVLEADDGIGGIWRYKPLTPSVAVSVESGPVSAGLKQRPMYRNLRTNLPTRVMEIPGAPFPSKENERDDGSCPQSATARFCDHAEVDEYLKRFAKKMKLGEKDGPSLFLNTKVLAVRKSEEGPWIVLTKNLATGETLQFSFHCLVVANGHYNEPSWPPIARLFSQQLFASLNGSVEVRKRRVGELIHHAMSYNCPEDYDDRRVLVLGFGPSAKDFLGEIYLRNKCASLSVSLRRMPLGPDGRWSRPKDLPHTIQCFPEVKKMELAAGSDRLRSCAFVSFSDGSTGQFDTIICATGYNHRMPFLEPDGCDSKSALVGGVSIENDSRVVRGLYEQLISIKDPTIAFPVLGFMVVPFPLAFCQAQLVSALWRRGASSSSPWTSLLGKTAKELHEEEDSIFQERVARGSGMPNFFHAFGSARQTEYCSRILIKTEELLSPVSSEKVDHIDSIVKEMYDATSRLRITQPFGQYRRCFFHLDPTTPKGFRLGYPPQHNQDPMISKL